jgi:hypothetical protein
MVYSFSFIIGGLILMLVVLKFKKTDRNIFEEIKSMEGIFAAILAIIIGIVTLFIGWK